MKDEVIIVSGLPRSGTSLMMAMLQAGGVSLLVDNLRKADKDNPRGYFELGKVKQIKENTSWLKEARGRAVKIVSPLLEYLPSDYDYKVIFMLRDLEEVMNSQAQMLKRRGENETNRQRTKQAFQKHLKQTVGWLKKQSNIQVFYMNYNELIRKPLVQAKKVSRFLGNELDVEKMVLTIDLKLYRQRSKSKMV